mgnify:CR=1 FL=1
MNTKTMTTLLRVVLLAAAVLCGIFFLWFLPSYGQEVQQADPEFTWAYWPCLIWAWLFALPIFGAMLPCWRIFGSISAPEGAFTRRNARDMRSISRLAFADALIFPAGMFVLAFMGAGSAPLTIIITPMVIFCCAAVGIVCYVLSRLIGDAAALREENGPANVTMANLSILKTGKAKAVRVETLNKLCHALDCQPGDLLEYRPDEEA